ncbi:hypothetical protein BAL199_03899 [alpha proteobacterium BAL199]|jgi:predicted TPR repeat methyltransferase|nr:hypothetical protein BAL199_03899 [alpha proteobacterium BAL199]
MSSAIAVAPVLVHQAIREHRSGRMDAASALYTRALEFDPTDPDALHLLGALHIQRGDAVAAVPYAAKAVLVEPAAHLAYNNLGLILKGAGQPGAAARCYRQATLIEPDFADGHSNLGVVVKADGQMALAVKHFRRAIEIDPSLGEAWNNLGNALQELGETEGAVEAYLTAADCLPDNDTVHYNVGLLLIGVGCRDDALIHLRRALELDPDREDAAHLVAALEGKTTVTAPRSYVRQLFDFYAARFDAHLVGDLRYQAHRGVVDLVNVIAGSDRRFALGYDLGCGTGLAGALVRERTGVLIGIDLSERMLLQADSKRIYDTLICADIDATLDTYDAAPDLVLASDVFIYIGELDGTIERIARRMAPGGLFSFSVELAAEGVPWFLRASGRYAHGDRYVSQCLSENGLRLLATRPIIVRHERGEPLDGAVYVAVKPTDDGTPV